MVCGGLVRLDFGSWWLYLRLVGVLYLSCVLACICLISLRCYFDVLARLLCWLFTGCVHVECCFVLIDLFVIGFCLDRLCFDFEWFYNFLSSVCNQFYCLC